MLAPLVGSYEDVQRAAALTDAQAESREVVSLSRVGTRPAGSTRSRIVAGKTSARAFADACRRALRSPDTVTVTHRLQSGRLDRRAVARAAVGAVDVFARRRLDVGERTSVVLMLDFSGSMSAACIFGGVQVSRTDAVLGVTSAIAPAIERAGAELELAAFGDFGRYDPENGTGCIAVLKPWTDRVVSQARFLDRFANLDNIGGTPMLAAMMWAERELTPRRSATRRVAIWLCDGLPNGGPDLVRRRVEQRIGGVEHVGIGLAVDLVASGVFPSGMSASVDDPTSLPRAFEQVLLHSERQAAARARR
jgi:hypothetical protein